MSTYRARLPKDIVAFLIDGCEAGPGPLTTLADHVRDGDEYDQPGWTYFDDNAVRALMDLPEHYDGVVSRDSDGTLVLSVAGDGYPMEYIGKS